MWNGEEAGADLCREVVVDALPFEQIAELMRSGRSLVDLSTVANACHGAWGVVRSAAYGNRQDSKFTKIGVLPIVSMGPKVANHVMVRALSEYLAKVSIGSVTVAIRPTLLSYAEFADTDPQDHQALRKQLIDQRVSDDSRDGCVSQGGQEWPNLMMLVFAVTRDGGLPILRHDPKAMGILIQEMGFAESDVLEPDFVEADVVNDGVKKWIDTLNTGANFVGWDVLPVGNDIAVVQLQGERGESVICCQIKLRTSQLSESGMADVLRHVAITANNFGLLGERLH